MQLSLTHPLQRLSRKLGAANSSIVASAGSVAGTTVITSALGFFYWAAAAKFGWFSTESIGFANASIASMTLLGTLGALGCGTLLIGELPRQPGRELTLISTALATVSGVGVFFGLLYALLAPLLAPNFAPLTASVGTVLLFAGGVALTAVAQVLDQALIGLLRGGLQMGRNTLFAAAKLALLLLIGWSVGGGGWVSIYITWASGALLSMLAVIALAARRGIQWRAARPDFSLLRHYWRAAIKHHGLNLALQGASSALPIVVAGVLSAETNAYFSYAWMISGMVFVAPLSLTMALYAVGARNPALLAQRMRFTLALATVVGVLVNLVLWLGGAQLVMSLFGPTFALNSTLTLCIVGLGVFPIIIKDHFVAIHRIHARADRAALFIAAETVFELVMAALGAWYGGLVGLALAWLAASLVMAVVMAPTVYRTATQRAAMPEQPEEGLPSV